MLFTVVEICEDDEKRLQDSRYVVVVKLRRDRNFYILSRKEKIHIVTERNNGVI